MISSIVVNWLKRRTLCPRSKSSSSSRSKTIIFPLAVDSSSSSTGWRVFGSIGQSKRNGCEQTFRSCMTMFCSDILFTLDTEPRHAR